MYLSINRQIGSERRKTYNHTNSHMNMSMKPKIRKPFKKKRCCTKVIRNHAKVCGDCKRCCCLHSLFVSHFVVCNYSHSEVNCSGKTQIRIFEKIIT